MQSVWCMPYCHFVAAVLIAASSVAGGLRRAELNALTVSTPQTPTKSRAAARRADAATAGIVTMALTDVDKDHVGLPWLLVTMNKTQAPTVQGLLVNLINFKKYALFNRGPYTMLGTFETIGLHELEGTEYHSLEWPQVEILYSSLSSVFSERSVKPLRVTEDTNNKKIGLIGKTPVFQAWATLSVVVLALALAGRSPVAAAASASAAQSLSVNEALAALAEQLPAVLRLERAMERPREDTSRRARFDFVVVGSGPAGSAVAARLASSPQRPAVLLLEAGDFETALMRVPLLALQMSATDASWGYTTVPQNTSCVKLEDSRCDYAVGHAVGGGTVINHMFAMRGNKQDYDTWEEMCNEGWSYEKLLPYFKLVERVEISDLQNNSYRGYDGPVPVNYPSYQTDLGMRLLRSAEQLGMYNADPNSASQSGMCRIQGTTRNGRRSSAYQNYVRPQTQGRNLYLRSRSLVTRILFDGDRAVGVRYTRRGKHFEVFADKEVIVAGGPVNSPALLLRSGVGPRSHLEELGIPVVKDLPVGYNLQDHVGLPWLLVTMNKTQAPTVQRLLVNLINFKKYALFNRGPYTMLGTLETIGLHELEGTEYHSPEWPQVEILYSSMSPVFSARSVKPFRITEDTYNKIVGPIGKNPVFQATAWRLRPRSRGRVSLQSADPSQAPLIDPQGLSHPEDVAVTVAGIRAFQRVLQAPALREVGAQLLRTPLPGCEALPWDSDAYWRCALRMHGQTLYHPCCTCKMGPAGDAHAVVGPDLKVRGLRGLRVVDTSVMPTLVSGHLQMAGYVIGEKAADLIRRDYPALQQEAATPD